MLYHILCLQPNKCELNEFKCVGPINMADAFDSSLCYVLMIIVLALFIVLELIDKYSVFEKMDKYSVIEGMDKYCSISWYPRYDSDIQILNAPVLKAWKHIFAPEITKKSFSIILTNIQNVLYKIVAEKSMCGVCERVCAWCDMYVTFISIIKICNNGTLLLCDTSNDKDKLHYYTRNSIIPNCFQSFFIRFGVNEVFTQSLPIYGVENYTVELLLLLLLMSLLL